MTDPLPPRQDDDAATPATGWRAPAIAVGLVLLWLLAWGTLDAPTLLAALAALALALAAARRGGGARPGGAPAAARGGSGDRLAAADAVLARIPDPVILLDPGAHVVEANDAARALLPNLRPGVPLSFALRDPGVLDGVEQALRAGAVVRAEYVERVSPERAFEVQIGPMAGAGEAARGVLLFFRDLTAARRLEHMRVDFIANASHELRTPLASLLGFIETLQGPARNDAAARERFLEIMRQQARRMTRLIDDLLSLSRIELRAHVPPETPVDMGDIVRQMIDTLAPLAAENGAEIALAIAEGPFALRGDRDELLRVVENLVENAIKYGASGGRIAVDLRRDDRGRILLAVADSGPGIAPEHLPRLTERFYRVDTATSRAKGGTGLGLAIVKHILNRHGGHLAIRSRPGEGAAFTVTLPPLSGAVPHRHPPVTRAS
ncbi:ATP-binding protein [Salinarimonas soli]|uniref:histidine kinase n=1 Tax=Salinarimonas soli TaxID=1638099 RepID=A0A5B2VD68_9HYPH|nr:ATP-binding protein [Salinarimonas soli]KAA2237443.1 PAS domain-containing protein [Salinarimonas soli]